MGLEPAVVVFYFVFYISVDCRFYWIRNNFLILCYVLPKKKNGKEESYDPILLMCVSKCRLFSSCLGDTIRNIRKRESSPRRLKSSGFYVPDPCELTFANTLLLSNAAISLGNAFISLEISCWS
jgi:hypothetical protein